MPTETRTRKIAGHTLTVSVHGREQAGTPLVLIHGAGGTYVQWPPRLRRLPGRSVYALELPGHGRTPGPGLATILAFVDLIAALLEQANLGPCIVGGHSLGAAIALALALRHPQMVAALILVGGGARLRVAPALLHMLRTDPAAAATFIVEHSYAAGLPSDDREQYATHLRRMDPETLYRAYAACDGFDVRPRLHELAVPLLIVGGEDDRMAPPHLSRELHDACPGSTLHILPATGHTIPTVRYSTQMPRRLLGRFRSMSGRGMWISSPCQRISYTGQRAVELSMFVEGRARYPLSRSCSEVGRSRACARAL
jgi:pimeloyl-ACP methyl ester carboxylesterase